MNSNEPFRNTERWESAMFLYHAALKIIKTRIDVISSEYKYVHNYNPIEHVKTRIKSPDSILQKMQRQGLNIDIETMIAHIHDIAGIRIICSFASDIERISHQLLQQRDFHLVRVKDYIRNPKPNGYKSLHMILKVPIHMSSGVVDVKVEVQIRTIAMDFWASLEHKIHYKFKGEAPEQIVEQLKECADAVAELDAKMQTLNEIVQDANRERSIRVAGFSQIGEEHEEE